MSNGTFKTEVWVHEDGVDREAWHYEIITRYWRVKEMHSHEWHSTVLRIDRQGNVEDVLVNALTPQHIDEPYWGAIARRLMTGQTTVEDVGSDQATRQLAYRDHAELVRLAAG